MSRIAIPEPGTLDARQREVHDRIASGPRGRVRGPLALWLHSPDLADRAQHLGEFLRYGTSFEPRLSELAILVTARHWTSHYEWFVHAPIAIDKGLAPEIVEAIKVRRRPDFAREDEAAVYGFVSEMLARHTIADATLAAIVRLFGERGAIELGAIIGYYVLGAVTLAAAALELPDGTRTCLPE